VPVRHAAEVKLPAVSGSSGRLVVERPKPDAVAQYPGRIFEDPELGYEDAMLGFVAASAQPRPPAPPPEAGTPAAHQAEIRAVRQTEAQLRHARREVRAQRQQEEAAWHTQRQQHRQANAAAQALTKPERRPQRPARRAAAAHWRAQRDQRRQTLAHRQQEDATWRQHRHTLRERQAGLPLVTAWIAILVLTDNCTRQCLGLPLFVAGASVTAAMVVAALRALLPADLQFLISDRGTHFTAQLFQQLAQNMGFLQVVIARHRPQSNGIAERLVRTLKEWLATHAWENDQDLQQLLAQFQPEYNDRPHLGLGIPGLSPNEFANRIWLM
jgi:transposase InsO family protein